MPRSSDDTDSTTSTDEEYSETESNSPAEMQDRNATGNQVPAARAEEEVTPPELAVPPKKKKKLLLLNIGKKKDDKGDDKKAKGGKKGKGKKSKGKKEEDDEKPTRGKVGHIVSVMDGTVQRALVGARSTFGGPDVQRVGIHFMVVFSFFHFLFVLLACVLSQIDVNGGGCFTYWGYKEECDNTSYTTRPDLFADKTAKNNFRAAAAFSIFSILLGVLLIGASWLLCCRLRRAIRIAKRKAVNHAQAKSKGGKSHYSRLDDIPNEDVAELTAKEEGEGEGGAHVQPVFAVGLIKWITVAIMSGGCLCGLICWAIMAGTYSSRAHSVQILLGKGAVVAGEKRDTSYGVGFGLQLTSWLLELIMVVLFSILI